MSKKYFPELTSTPKELSEGQSILYGITAWSMDVANDCFILFYDHGTPDASITSGAADGAIRDFAPVPYRGWDVAPPTSPGVEHKSGMKIVASASPNSYVAIASTGPVVTLYFGPK